jgi:tRNA threonylcarbamoyladenosine biosynthesis protein TsaB
MEAELLSPHTPPPFALEWLAMLILALDTSTQAGSLALFRDTRLLGVVSTWVEETYSSRMFRHLEFLLREVDLKLEQVELFAVSAGPGSFTGLRVGLTAVKGWAEVFGRPIAAVSALEAVAAQAKSQAELLAPVLDARRGQIYGGLYKREGPHLRRTGDEVVMAPGEFLDLLRTQAGDTRPVFVTPTPESFAPALAVSAYSACELEPVSTVLAPVIGRLGYARALRGELVDPLTLDANYVRRSDAEVRWKGA